jgi:hypothetical protein
VSWKDLVGALRGRRPGGGGEGICVARDGRTLKLELFKFDT